jgi:lysophospholipase L1-like esterase
LGVLASNVLVLAGMLALVEIGFRLSVEGYDDHRAFRATQPPPYDEAPFFSPEFIDESFAQPGGWRKLSGVNAIVPHDFRGEYFNVADGIRHTTEVPKRATATIYLLGGSTIYGSEVPDGYTIASYLQRKINKLRFANHRVVNLGVTSVGTNQQVERLRMTTLAAGDTVVFYDGVNDVIQGVLYGNAGDTIFGNDRSRSLGHRLMYRLSKHSIATRYVLARTNANYRIANLDARVAFTAERYRSNLDEAERIARAQGASFVHFLQPTLYSLKRRGDYERELLTYGFVPVQAEEAFVAAYPELKKVVASRAVHGSADFDLTAIFDALEEPVYLDGWHINHRGNEVIAHHILTRLGAAKRVHGIRTELEFSFR